MGLGTLLALMVLLGIISDKLPKSQEMPLLGTFFHSINARGQFRVPYISHFDGVLSLHTVRNGVVIQIPKMDAIRKAPASMVVESHSIRHFPRQTS